MNNVRLYYNNIKVNYVLPNTGVSFLIAAQFFNSIMVTTCKLLVNDDSSSSKINVFQILFFRMLITYLCCLGYMLITKSVPNPPLGPIESRKLLSLRGIFGFVGVFGMYFSLQYLSLSDAVAITFLIPIITGVLAWIILNERFTWLQGICSTISLAGVLLIAKPSFIFGSFISKTDPSVESPSTKLRFLAIFIGLIGVFGASLVYVVIRKMGVAVHPILSVSWFSKITCGICAVVITIVPSYKFVMPNSNYQWFLFLLIGFSGFIMQYCLTTGIQQVSAGKSSLLSYTNMIFALIWDLVIWHHLPGLLSCLGIIVIITCAVVVLKCKSPNEDTINELDLENNAAKYENIILNDFEFDDDIDSDNDNEQNRINNDRDNGKLI